MCIPSSLPTSLSVEEIMKYLKGASSHFINEAALVPGRFAWGREYGVFSVSHSGIEAVGQYVAGQEEHHRKRSFGEELQLLVERYGLKWKQEETVETVGERGRPL